MWVIINSIKKNKGGQEIESLKLGSGNNLSRDLDQLGKVAKNISEGISVKVEVLGHAKALSWEHPWEVQETQWQEEKKIDLHLDKEEILKTSKEKR